MELFLTHWTRFIFAYFIISTFEFGLCYGGSFVEKTSNAYKNCTGEEENYLLSSPNVTVSNSNTSVCFHKSSTNFRENDSRWLPIIPIVPDYRLVLPIESIVVFTMLEDSRRVDLNSLYTGEPFPFSCQTLQPLQGNKWSLVLGNGSKVCVNEGPQDEINCNIKQTPNYEYVSIKNWEGHVDPCFYDLRISDITFFNSNITSLVCNVPIWEVMWVSVTLNITIQESTKPIIYNGKIDYEFVEHEEGTIKCNFTGIPTPNIQWSKDGKRLPQEVIVSPDETSITFANFDATLEGKYKCLVFNFKGNASFDFVVTKKENTGNHLIVPLSVGIAASVTILSILILLLYRRYWLIKKKLLKLTDTDVDEFFNGVASDETEEKENLNYLPYNFEYEIPKEKIKLLEGQLLGEGQFGQVFKGFIEGLEESVALKTTKPDCHINMFKAFLLELKTMTYVGSHENIVRLIGACTKDIKNGILYIAMEYCELGSLEHFFQKNRCYYQDHPVNLDAKKTYQYENFLESSCGFYFKDLLIWSQQIAAGMEYLSFKKIIHSDLATRNVLLNCVKAAKITDFGLSRRLYQYTNYVKQGEEPLPWRWMAVESICFHIFSTKSDVWSYGITLWEIFSLGSIPYPGLSWNLQFGHQLELGLRNLMPAYATPEVYEMMKNCWNGNPDERPSFEQIHAGIKSYIKSCIKLYVVSK